MMEAVRTSETSVYSNETTRRYIPEGSNLHIQAKDFAAFISFSNISKYWEWSDNFMAKQETCF
jgi:hypothetical protein